MSEGSKNTLYENGLGWGILLIVLFVLGYIFWMYYDTEVRNVIRWLRYGEMWIMSWFIGDDFTVGFIGKEANWEQGFRITGEWTAEELKAQHMGYMTALTMGPLRYVFAVLAAFAGYWCMFHGPKTKYRDKLGLEGLIARQSLAFPTISPVVKFNPSNQPPRPPGAPVPADLPDFAEALGPEEWLAYTSIPAPDGRLDESALFMHFSKQLKGRWRGVKGLKPHEQILLAAFCLKASRKRDACDDMLGRIALCWSFEKGLQLSKDKGLLGEARRVLKNKDLAKMVLSQCNKHAFTTTALLRALATARDEGGVLASSQFVWLRAVDRALWYPMNNLGRYSFHTEALGAMSHYRVEKMTDRPVPIPKMEDAVSTTIEYMRSNKARPIPKLDYSGSKKRGVKKAT